MLHILLGYEYGFSDDFHLQLVLRCITRCHPHVPKRAKPVTPYILRLFRECMDHESSLHWNVYACGLLLFFSLARLGSVLPASQTSPSSNFLVGTCVNFSIEGLLVTFLRTKTIQFGERRLHVPLIRLDSVLCPVRAYERALSLTGHHSSTPAFVYRESGRMLWLTKSVFIGTFRSVLQSQGLDHLAYTGHSFRRGGGVPLGHSAWEYQVNSSRFVGTGLRMHTRCIWNSVCRTN